MCRNALMKLDRLYRLARERGLNVILDCSSDDEYCKRIKYWRKYAEKVQRLLRVEMPSGNMESIDDIYFIHLLSPPIIDYENKTISVTCEQLINIPLTVSEHIELIEALLDNTISEAKYVLEIMYYIKERKGYDTILLPSRKQ